MMTKRTRKTRTNSPTAPEQSGAVVSPTPSLALSGVVKEEPKTLTVDIGKAEPEVLRQAVNILQAEIEARWRKSQEDKLKKKQERYDKLGKVLTNEVIDALAPEHRFEDCWKTNYDSTKHGLWDEEPCVKCTLIDLKNGYAITDPEFGIRIEVD